MSTRQSTGGAADHRALRQRNAGDLNFDERELGAFTFALCCAASPFVIVGLIVLGYMKFA